VLGLVFGVWDYREDEVFGMKSVWIVGSLVRWVVGSLYGSTTPVYDPRLLGSLDHFVHHVYWVIVGSTHPPSLTTPNQRQWLMQPQRSIQRPKQQNRSSILIPPLSEVEKRTMIRPTRLSRRRWDVLGDDDGRRHWTYG
jgi:hypothetical protein